MQKIGLGAGVFVVEDFLSKAECDNYIAKSESLEYEDATIQTPDGPRIYQDARNNYRIIYDGTDLADFIFARARDILPDIYNDEWKLLGLNERFGFYQYEPGEYLSGTRMVFIAAVKTRLAN